ncbi:MAG: hypothetical protein AAFR73_12115 [Pseudomonadota bacterium]
MKPIKNLKIQESETGWDASGDFTFYAGWSFEARLSREWDPVRFTDCALAGGRIVSLTLVKDGEPYFTSPLDDQLGRRVEITDDHFLMGLLVDHALTPSRHERQYVRGVFMDALIDCGTDISKLVAEKYPYLTREQVIFSVETFFEDLSDDDDKEDGWDGKLAEWNERAAKWGE